MAYRIIFSRRAARDLKAIRTWIADLADVEVADRYLDRVRAKCMTLIDYPARGTPHEDVGVGYRSLAFERRLTVIYRVESDTVTIMRVLHAARDLEAILRR